MGAYVPILLVINKPVELVKGARVVREIDIAVELQGVFNHSSVSESNIKSQVELPGGVVGAAVSASEF